MPKALPPVVIGPVLIKELGEDRGYIINRLMQAGIRVIMDPFGLDDTPLEVQRLRWKAARETIEKVAPKPTSPHP
jgi:hypothetical protein